MTVFLTLVWVIVFAAYVVGSCKKPKQVSTASRIAELERWHANWEAQQAKGELVESPPQAASQYDPYAGDPTHPSNCVCKVRT